MSDHAGEVWEHFNGWTFLVIGRARRGDRHMFYGFELKPPGAIDRFYNGLFEGDFEWLTMSVFKRLA